MKAMAAEAVSGTRRGLSADAKRSVWWRVHQWAGLQLSLFLSVVFVTGTLAVFSYEMDWLLRPAMWVAPAADRVAWGEVARAAQTHAPDAEISVVYGPLHPAATFDVVMTHGDRTFHVYVHPRTGEVTGEGAWAGVQRFLRNTHRHLMLPVKWGVSIVSLAALALAVSLVTSFWVYKKWWRGFFRLPTGRTARAYIGDLHRLGGLWSVWFILLMIVTGIWYFIEQWGGAAPSANPAAPPALFAGTPGEMTPAPSVFDAVARAEVTLRQTRPDFRMTQISWIEGEDDLLQLQGTSPRAILVRPRANTVWVDPATGGVVGQADPSRLSLHTRISEAADPLHFGTFGGYLTKTIWFVFGGALSGLAITGVVIYVLRIAKDRGDPSDLTRGVKAAWLAMGILRWPALILVLLPVVVAPFVL